MTQQEHEAAFRLRSSGVCVRVVQDTTKVDGLGGEVWAGALVLCEFLDANDTDYVCGRDVVELGAGCGLCGLVAAALGAKTAILTDEYPDLLASNIAMNCHIWAEREATSDSKVATSGALEWGVLESIAPFVHNGCKHVEYLKNRTVWRRAPRVGLPSDSEEDAADDQESEDDALLRQAEDNWRMSISNSCNVSKVSGLSSELCDVGGMHAFRCADCGNIVADRDDIVSKTFFGRTGKAFLMNNMYNIRIGSARNRYLMTGMHTIGDVLCSQCDFVLGWKYIKAMESSQKYKEGKFIMEQAVVQDDSEEQAWNRL
ncbi:hypothetical protein BBO99_00008561 [Phytophthora kernoviae]|uniref:Yippee domain-containing protein n=2 Tax=Phytophthora kernoviae TaxID=325452 RepID=A0A3R7JPM7_9STRA|nr:hypothetical protein G195_010800 [Phytophthora kernoviae 00238/432]KAG2510454.1 hypothetical protein JM16_008293 [Phytophthora kernoviae]KAG2520045.1 hypothetical protein JM18_007332 [Phytophthora kernoviae]RLN10061.1 hypothetical protein BBI17_008506 [Phytophthora kernoviae]RLN75072.1 hypothetical protein BBO99_00008561 [Phytophthora kernoviae]